MRVHADSGAASELGRFSVPVDAVDQALDAAGVPPIGRILVELSLFFPVASARGNIARFPV
jgi:hypothetical protein